MWEIINNNVNRELQNRGKRVVFIAQQTWIFQGNISFLWQEPVSHRSDPLISPTWEDKRGKRETENPVSCRTKPPASFSVWWFLPFLSSRWWREDIPAVFTQLLPDFTHFLEKKRRETSRVFFIHQLSENADGWKVFLLESNQWLKRPGWFK